MRVRALACTCVMALAAATAAPALADSVNGTVASSDVNLQFRSGGTGNPGGAGGLVTISGNIISGSSGSTTFGSGASYASTSKVEPGFIYFKNGNASVGQRIQSVSKTLVDITFSNTSDRTVTPFLNSQILPAGFGMFVSQPTCPNDPSACNPDQALGYNPARTFASFRPSSLAVNPTAGYELAKSTFEFNIYAENLVDPVYSLTGSLTLLWGGGGGNFNTFVADIAAPAARLTGWAPDANSDDYKNPTPTLDFVGFTWDSTDILVNFPDPLAPGASATLRYETIVTTTSDTDCVGPSRQACLLTYASFGDPLGRSTGGGGASLIAPDSMLAFTAFGALPRLGDTTPGSGIFFDEFAFRQPVFNPVTGGVTYVTQGNAVPEPDSWALMIAGFGILGATLRQRRRAVA